MAPAKKKQKLSNGSTAPHDTLDDVDKHHEAMHAEKTPKDEAEQQRRSLFVRSLPANTTAESLTALFSESYPIKHATAVIDPTTKECKGYGFVTFADAEDAQRAKDELNGHVLDGRKLRIELAQPRHRDSENARTVQTGAPKPSTPKQQDIPQPSRLIVRNLPWTIKTDEQLAKLFLSYGKIKQAYMPKNKRGLLAGFGFVVLRGRKNAEKALEGVNGKEVDGRTLAVDWAVSKNVYEGLLLKGGKEGEGEADGGGVGVAGEKQDGDVEHLEDIDESVMSEDEDEVSDVEDEALDERDDDVQMQDEGHTTGDLSDDRATTIFVRNLPFTCTDDDLEEQFANFGKTRYARVVIDFSTDRSKGTGFVCFYEKSDADACLRGAPKRATQPQADSKDAKGKQMPNSILEDADADPSGQYTMEGRVLQISRAVDKSEANRLTQESAAQRRKRHEDKRRVYLLSEGTISSKSKLWEKLSPTERNMRDASAKQRKSLIESNPSLHLSLTRLSIRNIPRSVTSKDLKSLAREAVVGFATDVRAGSREKLSKEELARGGEEMQDAEKARKKSGKGVVKQAKVVFEGAGGSKVSESSGAGRSRGYGFIEYFTHRSALMGLRWLNGHKIEYQVQEQGKVKASHDVLQDRKKRLIVEFAIENAQVVMRRQDREVKARDRGGVGKDGETEDTPAEDTAGNVNSNRELTGAHKRKRGAEQSSSRSTHWKGKPRSSQKTATAKPRTLAKGPVDEKLARRNRIIGRKRAMRARKGSKN